MHAAARAAVRVNRFRDRKAVNVFCNRKAVDVFCDRRAVNNLEFTFFSLLWSATVRPDEPAPSRLGLKLIPLPGGFYERIANLKV